MHSRPLLRHHEFAARKITLRLGQQYRDLKRKDMLAVEILMQAVIVARPVLEQQRRRFALPGSMTTPNVFLMRPRIPRVETQDHWAHDVAVGAAIGILSNYDLGLMDTRVGGLSLKPALFQSSPALMPGAAEVPHAAPGLQLEFRF